ncbi:MAG TPA: alpha-L-fucosidase [Candidatus Mediterraneibacter caccavium]|uniref:alpha-L-fucosidase n=1 Tax=Candidatus Mediterraneibacter caccavium TaxID=2838661 RepID=A0A9D2ATL5_9FIRM|nr:alpha-L-fucosidase [Candidatus Mediterraneibacter caccavium]
MGKVWKKLLAAAMVTTQISVMAAPVAFAEEAPAAPEAWGPTPNEGQMKYYKDELAGFVHFGVNQYTGAEWGNGQEDPDIFQPENLDTDQWIEAFQAAGIKRAILTSKHHDGFALFPTKWSPNKHSVESSSWRDGKGDVVQEFVNSCKKYGMDLGFYLSPWDQGNPWYDRNNEDGVDYNDVYIGQMEELMNYADEAGIKIVEFWLDGACGAPSVRPKYDIARWWARMREYDPNITFQQNYGAPLRWVGNEAGYANSDSSWQTLDYDYVWNLYDQQGQEDAGYLFTGEPYIKGQETQRGNDMEHMVWSIPEVDVSITSGWFGNGGTNAPKSPETLAEMYFNSVGLGSPFLLNVPPNRDGKFDERYVETLKEFGEIIDNTFDDNVAEGASAVATAVRGNHPDYDASNTTDGDYDTYWTMDDGQTTGSVTVDLDKPTLIDVVEIQEYIPLGQRISKFTAEVNVGTKENPNWQVYGSAGTIGYKRLIKGAPVTASQIRVTVDAAYAVPLINNIAAYKADDRIAVEPRLAPGKIEAEEFDSKSGGLIAEEKLPGVGNIGAIGNGNYTVYKGVDFKQIPTGVNLTYAGEGSPEITVRVDSVDGPVIAKVTVEPTGSYTSYTTIPMELEPNLDIDLGLHDVYLCLNAGLNVDSFEFLGENVVQFANATQTAYEGENAQVVLQRSGESPDTEVTVDIETSPGTAVHGRHYIDKTETITFAAGEVEKTIEIQTVENEETTGPLDFTVEVRNPSANAAIGQRSVTTVVIQDNDQPGDASALQDLVDEAKGKVEADYMPEDWTKFQEVLAQAEALLENAEASQKELDDMTALLQESIDGLRPFQYTEENPFVLSATEAVDVEAEYMIPQGGARVNSRSGDSNGKEVEEMGMARSGVEGYVDFYFDAPAAGTYNFHMRYFTGANNTLMWMLNDDESTKQQKALKYTGGGAGVFEEDDLTIVVPKAGVNKIKFYNDKETTCNLDKFTITAQDIETEKPSKNTLEFFLNKAKEHQANGDVDNCVESIKNLFAEAIAEGEAVMADENATYDEVMDATVKLMKAIQALDMKAADKTDLEMAAELAQGIDLTKYVEAGQAEFQQALAAAQEVLVDGDAMQADADTAWNALVDAISNLRLKADKSTLEDLLNSVADLDLSQYTEESAAVFRTALSQAQAVMADETLIEDDQKTVDDAVQALSDAKDQLQLKDTADGDGNENTGDGDSQTPDNGGNSGNNGNSGNSNAGNSNTKADAPKTGDTTMPFAMLALAGLAAGTGVVTFRKKHNR